MDVMPFPNDEAEKFFLHKENFKRTFGINKDDPILKSIPNDNFNTLESLNRLKRAATEYFELTRDKNLEFFESAISQPSTTGNNFMLRVSPLMLKAGELEFLYQEVGIKNIFSELKTENEHFKKKQPRFFFFSFEVARLLKCRFMEFDQMTMYYYLKNNPYISNFYNEAFSRKNLSNLSSLINAVNINIDKESTKKFIFERFETLHPCLYDLVASNFDMIIKKDEKGNVSLTDICEEYLFLSDMIVEEAQSRNKN